MCHSRLSIVESKKNNQYKHTQKILNILATGVIHGLVSSKKKVKP